MVTRVNANRNRVYMIYYDAVAHRSAVASVAATTAWHSCSFSVEAESRAAAASATSYSIGEMNPPYSSMAEAYECARIMETDVHNGLGRPIQRRL